MVIIILLFSPGRISRVAKELSSGIREFQSGLKGNDGEDEDETHADDG